MWITRAVMYSCSPFTDRLWRSDLEPGSEWDRISSSGHHLPGVQHQGAARDIRRHCHAVRESGEAKNDWNGGINLSQHPKSDFVSHQGELINNIEKNVTSAAEYVEVSKAETCKAVTYKKNPYKIASLPSFFKRKTSNPSESNQEWAPEPVDCTKLPELRLWDSSSSESFMRKLLMHTISKNPNFNLSVMNTNPGPSCHGPTP